MDADEADYRERLQRALGDDFELRTLIGRGGFGNVYAARDRELDRDVAVKTLRHDLFPTRAVLERFRREARAVAKLRHPNILPVYSVGEGEGIAFMIMPLIRGESLATVLERAGSLSQGDAVRIASDVARALDAAHQLGIVHRDVKPENILLEGEDRHVLLADFGIAKAAESDTELTGTGIIVGSPQYMSPEQAGGDKDFDARSDVYSLGAVAYEMLSGHPPYQAETFQKLLVKRLMTEPMPLAERALAVGAPISDVVMRSLARNREDRWSSAGAFASALQVAGGSAPAAARSDDVMQESWFARRGLLLFGLGVTMFYLEVTAAVFEAAGARPVVALMRPVIAILQFGIPLLIAEMLARIAVIRLGGGSWTSALRAALGQPRWWQPWYPRSLRDPLNVWERMPAVVKTLRTILAIDLVAIPFMLPLIGFVPQLADIAEGTGTPLPLPVRIVIVTSNVLQPLLYASIAVLVGGVLTLSVWKKISAVSVLECLLTWRRDRWTATEARRLLSTSVA